MWNKYFNLAGIAVLKIVSGLPFRLLYLLSDAMFVLIYHMSSGTGGKVVQTNLKNSFPDKSWVELRKIEYNYYRYLCDLIIEALKRGT
jgi:Kdo2-lipid IVA lauroyltransferase/acyltransferase